MFFKYVVNCFLYCWGVILVLFVLLGWSGLFDICELMLFLLCGMFVWGLFLWVKGVCDCDVIRFFLVCICFDGVFICVGLVIDWDDGLLFFLDFVV